MNKRILIVEDDRPIIELIEHYLGKEHFALLSTTSGDAALKMAVARKPHLVILDIMLPGIDGLEVCRELRKNPQTASIPILMLTAKAEESDKIIGLELGADDYMTKPFSPKELVARVRALLRRTEYQSSPARTYSYDKLELDSEKHEVKYDGKPLDLTSKEFGLLQALLQKVGKLFSRETLLATVWGEDYYGGSRTVDVHIRKLREKIPSLAQDIITVKGFGYKLRIK
mgnify:CR=1 FL=1